MRFFPQPGATLRPSLALVERGLRTRKEREAGWGLLNDVMTAYQSERIVSWP